MTEKTERRQKYPWQLAVAVLAWAVLAVVTFMAAVNNGVAGPDEGSVAQIQSTLGDRFAATGSDSGTSPVLLTFLGAVIVLLTVFLAIGQGWARWVLAVLGVVMVIVFALDGKLAFHALVALGALILGSVPLLAPKANSYLAPSK